MQLYETGFYNSGKMKMVTQMLSSAATITMHTSTYLMGHHRALPDDFELLCGQN